ncbi:MAG: ABC transporter substrate-binding protein [Erysipelotrichaceae bacterium]|nr:ABC transporter substrate-binding protein [Erysipelotrichaceae bacterium]
MKKFFTCLLVFALLAGCSSANGGGNSNTYKIGLHFELTGGAADYGNAELNGAQLAIKLANEKAGSAKYEGVVYDDLSSTTEAVTIATTLAASDVVGIVGPATSGASAATYQISNDSKKVVISPSATANNITLVNPDDASSPVFDYVFRVCFEDSYQGAAMAQFAYDHLNARRVAIYGDSTTDYAKGLTASFTNQFNKLGGSIITTQYYVAKDTDFSSVLTNIKSMNFDVLYIPGYYEEAGLIIKQARAMGIDCPIIGGDGFDSKSLLDLAGADALNQVYFTTAYTTAGASDSLQAFIDAYQKEYHEEPSMFAALAFDATNLLIEAIESAGSKDPAKIQDALVNIQFDGITGSFSFDKAHTPIKSVLVVELVDGVQSGAISVSPAIE